MRKQLLLIVSLFIVVFANAQVANDFRSVATGNWNALATWERYDGVSWAAATVLPGATANNGNVTIQDGTTVTVTAAPTAAISSLTVGNGTSGALSIGGFAITITGSTTIAANGSITVTSATGAKIFTGDFTNNGTWTNTAANSPITMSGNITNNGTFNSGTGVYTLNGASKTISTTNSSALTINSVTVPSGASISVSANFTSTNPFTVSTALLIGTAATSSVTNNGFLSSPSVTMSVAGNSFTNNGTLNITGTGGVLAGAGTFTNAATGTLNYGANAAPTVTTFTTTAAGNTVVYNGSGAQAVRAVTYSNLTIDNVNQTATVATTFTVSNNLRVNSGTLLCSVASITGNATGTCVVASGATLQLGNGATAVTFPTLYTNANTTLTGSTVIYGCTVAQTVSGVPTYGNLTIQGASVKTLGAATTVNGNLSIATGATLADGAFQLTGNSTGTFTIAGTGALQIGAATATITAFPTNFLTSNISLAATSTVTYTTTTNGQTVAGSVAGVGPGTYGNLVITGTSGTKTLSGNATVAGNFTMNTSVPFADGGNTLTVNGNITNNGTHSGAGKISVSGGSAAHTVTCAVTGGFSTLEINDATWTTTLNNTGTSLTTTITNLNVVAGTLVISTFTTGNILTVTNTNVTGTLNFNGNSGTRNMGNITVNSGGSVTFTSAPGNINLVDLTINSGGTWNSTIGTTFAVSGSVTNNGTFNSGSGTYTLSGAAKTINGTIQFTGISMSGTYTNNGTMTVTTTFNGGGTLTQGANATLNCSVAPIPTLNATASGNTVRYFGSTNLAVKPTTFFNLTIDMGTAATTATGATPGITVSNNLLVNGGIFADAGFQTVGNATGTLTVANGATIQYGAGGATTSNFPTNFTTANTTLGATSITIYNTTSAVTVSGVPPSYGSLTLSGASTKTMGAAKTIQGNLTINAGTFADGGFVVTVNGNISNLGAHSGTGKILLTGGTAQHSITGSGSFVNVELDDAFGATNGASPTISGVFTQTSGTWSIGSGTTLTLSGSLAATGSGNFGGTTSSGLTISGTGALGNTLRFASGVQNLSVLTISRTSGSFALGSDLTVNASGTGLSMSGTTLLNLGNYTLTLASASTISGTFGVTNMIIADATGGNTGELRKTFATGATAAFTFPIGDISNTATDYSPYSITMSANSTQRIIGVKVVDATHPQNTSNGAQTDYVSRYWQFSDSQSGIGTYSYSAESFTYSTVSPTDVNGTPSNYRINRYDGANWYQLNSTTTAPTSTTSATYTETTGTLGGNDFTLRVNPAQTYTWVATSGSGDWNTAANWTPSRIVPSNTDILQFTNGGTPTATNIPSQTIGSLLIDGNTDVTFTSVAASQTLAITNTTGTTFTVGSGSTLRLSSTGAFGTIIGFSGTNVTNIAGTIVINTVGATNGLNFTSLLAANNTITGTITNNGGTITATTTTTTFGAGSFYNHNMSGGAVPTANWNATSTCTVSGATTPTTFTGVFGNLTINTSGTATLSAASTVAGNLTVSAGTFSDGSFQITGNNTGTLSVANGATLQIGTAAGFPTFPTLFTTGNISLATGSTVIYGSTAAQSVAGLTYHNLSLINAGAKTFAAAPTINGNFAITGCTVNDGGFQITGNATGTFTMSASASSILVLGTTTVATAFPTNFIAGNIVLNSPSIVRYNSNLSQTVSNVPTYSVLQLQSAAGTPTKTLAGNTLVTGSATPIVSIGANNTFNLGGFNLTLQNSGTSPISNSGTISANTDGGSTITLTGTGHTFAPGTILTTARPNLILNVNSGLTVTIAQTSPLVSLFNVTIPANNILSLSAGAQLGIAGAYSNSGTLTANTSGTTITLNGSSPQTFTVGTYTGSSIGSGTLATSGGLVINNAAGVTLGSALNVPVLTLTSGILTTTNTNLLTVTGTALTNVTGGGTSVYVNGPLARTIAASWSTAGAMNWPVGKSAYQLFTLTNPTTSAGGTVVIRVEAFDASTGGTAGPGVGSLLTSHYWQATFVSGQANLTSAGSAMSLTETGLTSGTHHICNSSTLTGSYNLQPSTYVSPTLTSTSAAPIGLGFFAIGTAGTLCGTYSVGPTGDFGKLTNVANILNTATVTCDVVFELQTTYDGTTGESFPIVFNQFTTSGGSWTATVRPIAGATNRVTSGDPGTTVTPTINFNGVDRLTFDGRSGGTGSAINWTIRNTNVSASPGPAIQLQSGANNNVLRYLQIESQNQTLTSGTVFISAVAAPSATNDGDLIEYCNITNYVSGANAHLHGIFAYGNANTAFNNNMTVRYNNISNFTSYVSTPSSGITVSGTGLNTSGYGSGWTIQGNSFFRSVVEGTNSPYQYNAINFITSPGGGASTGNVISDNFIGGSASAIAGGAISGTWITGVTGLNTTSSSFQGINIQANGVTVSNNQIGGIFNTNPSTGSSSMAGIVVSAGTGTHTITGNIIGTTAGSTGGKYYGTSTSSVLIGTGTKTFTTQAGLAYQVGDVLVVYNTTPANFMIGTVTAYSSTSLTINVTRTGGSGTLGSWIIGNAAGIFNYGQGSMVGIWAQTAATSSITNNTIANLTNNAATATASTNGIITQSGTYTITGNTIYHLVSGAATTTAGLYTGTDGAVFGISQQATVSANQTVSGNTVFNLISTLASATATKIYGIGLAGVLSNSFSHTANANNVHSFDSPNANTLIQQYGIYQNSGTYTISNNMVRLGIRSFDGSSITASAAIQGITDATAGSASFGTQKYYHNSVYIGGSGVASGTINTFAFRRNNSNSSPKDLVDIRNNIFTNVRANASGTGVNAGIGLDNTTNVSFCDYNNVYNTGTGSNYGWVSTPTTYATKAAWNTATGFDANTNTGDPLYISPATAVPNLHINTSTATPIESAGTAAATTTNDIDGDNRAANSPVDMGADAGMFIPIDVTAPTITYTNFANPCNTVGSTYNVSNVAIVDNGPGSSVNTTAGTKPRLYYKKSTDASNTYNDNTNATTGWKFVEANGTTSPFNFDINFSLLNGGSVSAGDVIQYFIVAQDQGPNVPTNPNVAINSGTFNATPSSVALTTTAFPIGGTINTFTILPCQGTVTVGSSGANYTSLTNDGGIFAAINAITSSGNTLSGNLTVNITTDLTAELGTNALNQWAESGVGGYTVTFQSSVPGTQRAITGGYDGATNAVNGLVRINGADRVTFNGGTGTQRSLRFRNTTTAPTNGWNAAISFYGDAVNNTINNCTIEAGNFGSQLANGVVYFGAGTTGNDNNTITNCDIKNGTGFPIIGIYSIGSSASASNDGNIITGNNIYDFYSISGTGGTWGTSAINLEVNNNSWQITNNNIYQTAIRTSTTATDYYGIVIGKLGSTPATSGNGFTITGNKIGGSGRDGSGNITGFWRENNSGIAHRFCGIFFNGGTGTASTINNNTISAIDLITTSAGSANFGAMCGINLLAGAASIDGNTIGSTTAASTMLLNSTISGSSFVYGIRAQSATTTSISNNNIGGIVVTTGTGGTSGTSIYGISITAGIPTISGNTIGSTSIASSLQITGANVTNNSTIQIFGIHSTTSTSGTITMSSNVIRNLNNTNVGTTTNNTTQVGGIFVASGSTAYSISSNRISMLTTASTSNAATVPAAFGIISASTATTNSISSNFISDITSSTTTQTTQTWGIGILAGSNSVSNNKLTVIRNNSQNTTSTAAIGINLVTTTSGQTISGNTIHSLITNSNSSIRAYGINYAGPTSGTNTISGNTIHSFTPNGTTSSNIQAGIYLASGTCNVTNNVIRLGLKADNTEIDFSNLLVGIQDASTSVNNIYYNSVFITGNSTSVLAGNSYAMYRSATPGSTEIVRNNIFANNRTGGSSASRHFAYASNTSGSITMDNNIFQTNASITTYYGFSIDGTNAVTGVTALHAIRSSISGQNLRSGIATLAKINFTSATADTASFNLMLGNINCAAGAGLGITGITTDAYGYSSRATGSTSPTAIGAHESGSFSPISTTDAANGTDIYTPVITVSTISTQSTACGTSITIPVTATVTDVGTGVATGAQAPTLWYKESTAGSWTPVTAGAPTGNTYPFSVSISGIVGGQTYYYYVAAQDQAATPNVWYSHFNATTPVHATADASPSPQATTFGSFTISSTVPLSGTVIVGGTIGSETLGTNFFNSLSGGTANDLFYAINTRGLSGDLNVLVRGATVAETGNQSLTSWTEYCGTGYKILVRPEDPSTKVLSGSLLGMGLIQLDGADRVTFDGRYNSTGTTRYLKFVNTYSGTGGSENDVFRFGSTATNDTIRFCDIECSSTKEAGGAINISTNSSNIVIDNNLIHGGTAWTSNCILADGSSNITITNNELYNFSITGLRAYGIRVNSGNGSNWTITGNSIYNTGTNSIGTQTGIGFLPGTSSTNNTVSNNYIGGSAANAGACSSCTNKMWRNSYAPSTTLNDLTGISVSAGNVTVSNNTIKRIWNSDPIYSAIVGIQVLGSAATVSNNTLGGTFLADYQTNAASADALQVDGGAGATYPGFLYGITSTASSAVTIDGNVFNILLQNGATAGGSLTSILVQGAGVATITNNDNATNGHQETWGIYGWHSYGIWLEPSASSSGHLIANNKIVTPQIDGSGINQVSSNGIWVNILGSRTVSGTIRDNIITDNSTVENSGFTEGIFVTTSNGDASGNGTWNIVNNMIYLSNPGQTLIRTEMEGIDVALNSSSTANIHNNTVWIDGFNRNNTTTLANPSMAFFNAAGPSGGYGTINLRNNILINTRQGGSPNSDTYHVAIWRATASATGLTTNNNVFVYRNGSTYGRMAIWGINAMYNLSTWQGYCGGDANSYNPTWVTGASNYASNQLNPSALFTQATSNADLHIDITDGESYKFVDMLGALVATTTDYDGETRDALTPDIGADEFAACSIVSNTVTSAQTICSGSTPSALDGSVPTTTPGSPTYQWEQSTTSGTLGFTNASGTSTGEDYSPGALTQTTWYRRKVTAGACTDYSAAVQITVNPAPTANAAADQTICYTGGTLTGASSTNSTGIVWTTSGTGTFTPNNTTIGATYVPSSADITAGAVTLTLTANNTGCTAATDTKDLTILPNSTWIGSISTNWFTPGNWCLNGTIPTSSTNVNIPHTALTDFDPLIGGAGAVVGNIDIFSGGVLGISGTNNLDVHGNWSNSGTFDYQTSTVTFKGTGNASVGGSTNPQQFYNLKADKGTNITPELTIAANTTVLGALQPTNGLVKIDATTGYTLTLSSATTIASTSGLEVPNGQLTANSYSITNNGLFRVGGGNADIGSLTNNSGSTYTTTGGVTTIGGSVSNTGATVSATGGSLTLGVSTTGNWSNASSTSVTFNGTTVSIPGDVTSSASTMNANSATVSIGGNVTNSSASTFGVGGSTVTVGGAIVSTSSTVNHTAGTLGFNTLGGSYNANAVFDVDGASTLNITNGTYIFQQANGGTGGDVKIIAGAGTKTITGGTFQFGNGSTPASQVFTVNNTAVDFNNVTINGTNSPKVRLLANAATRSAGVLTVNGILDLNQYAFTVKNGANSAISRTSPGYVLSESQSGSSRLLWNIGTTTGTNYVFPMGDASGNYLPVTMNLSAGEIGMAGVASFNSPGVSSGNWPTGAEAVTNVANPNQAIQRFWHLESDQAPTTYTVDVTFSFPSAEDPTAGIGSNVKMQRYNKPTNAWDSPDQYTQSFSNTAPRSVTVQAINKFSWWGGGNDGNNPLPINLVDFKAGCDGETVTINWTTATEVNNDYFTVQRSTDLVTFVDVAVVDGAGNSNAYRSYSAKDLYAVGGTSYYRLIQTDFDGQQEVFSPVAVQCVTTDKDVIGIFPNPAKDMLTVNMNLSAEDRGNIVIYNQFGQQVATHFVQPAKGFNNYVLDISGLAAGQYFISFNMTNKVLPTQKLVITK